MRSSNTHDATLDELRVLREKYRSRRNDVTSLRTKLKQIKADLDRKKRKGGAT